MKKQLLFLIMMLLPLVANAHDIEVKNADGVTIYYNYINGGTELEVTYRGNDYRQSGSHYWGAVVIPEEVTYLNKTRKVTSIGDYSFRSCYDLYSVTIPNSVTYVGVEAFSYINIKVIIKDIAAWCNIKFANYIANPLYYAHHLYLNGEEIKDLIIPNSVRSIGDYAFVNCSGLTSVTIPNSVTEIGEGVFYGCSGLTSLTIPNSVTSIGGSAFAYCSGLTSLTIPNSVTSIGGSAFAYCSGLTSITIGSGLSSIISYGGLFSSCDRLTAIVVDSENKKYDSRNNCNAIIETSSNQLIVGCQNTIIPNSVTSIGGSAFAHCSGLTSISIPNSVTSIENNAFAYCSGLTSISIPNSVTSIGAEAFGNCTSLTSITIPNSVTRIRSYAFAGCTGLNSISIPNSVTSIENNVFQDCSGLTSITIPNSVTSIDNCAFYGCKSLTFITIPNSVTSIGESAFSKCASLTTITFPNNVTTISYYSFYECKSLTTVIIGNGIKKIGEAAFGACSKIADVTCYAEAIPNTNTYIDVFKDSNIKSAILHVPSASVNAYKAAYPWKNFKSIVAIDGETPTTPKCEKPTISYENGQLKMSCATEGVEYVTDITDADVKKHYDAIISLNATYNISVYATKSGYDNSDVATATLSWIDASPKTEGITNGVAQIAARPVLVKTDNGFITVEGADDRTNVSVYTTDGKQVGSAISQNNIATIATSIQPGSMAIVKVGEKAVKVVMK